MNKKYIYASAGLIAVFLVFIYFYMSIKINLVYMCNSAYLPYVMTSLETAIETKDKKTFYNVHIIAKDFTKNDIENIKKMEQKDVKINIIEAKDRKLNYENLGRFASFSISLQKIFIAQPVHA